MGFEGSRVTMSDVAREAGVSTTTVSHVINGTRPVNDDTRDRVLSAIRALKYHHNQVARSLARQRTGTIGVVIEEITNPLFPPVLHGVEREAALLGYSVIASSAPDFEGEDRALATLQEKRVDGVILLTLSIPRTWDHLRDLRSDGLPVVAINRYPRNPAIDTIYFDNPGAAATATEHLARLGHSRIAHLAGPVSGINARPSAIERAEGFRRAMESQGLSTEERYFVQSEYGYEPAYVAATTLLATDPPPTGVVAWNDHSALALLRAAHQRGMSVPDDLAIVGIGDESFSIYTHPRLTSVRLPVREAGSKAAQLLNQLILDSNLEPQIIVLPCQLLVRESCGAGLVAERV